MACVPTQATAASFFIDLCAVNATECAGDNITEASLLFDEILGGDANDYNLTMTLTGTGTDTVDQVQFTIDGVADARRLRDETNRRSALRVPTLGLCCTTTFPPRTLRG